MTGSSTIIMAVAAVAGAALTYQQGQKAADLSKNAADQSTQNAQKQAGLQEQQVNQANAQRPSIAGISSANQQAVTAGAGSTMLTGATGVNPNALTLGKSTLLGG